MCVSSTDYKTQRKWLAFVSEIVNYVGRLAPRKLSRFSLDITHCCSLLASSQAGNGVTLKSWMIFRPLKKHLERKNWLR